MGLSSSKDKSSGSLQGAYAPPLPDVVLPKPLDPEEKKYKIACPADKKGGDRMVVAIKGKEVPITIPENVYDPQSGTRTKIRPGDKFSYVHSERKRVIASTLPNLPGATIVEAKPMIWANASYAYFNYNWNDQTEQISIGKQVGRMLQEAQEELLQKALDVGCNAVLSINMNISSDSSGENGNSKLIIATLCGTPCIVMPSESMPVVNAEATLVTAYNG